MLLYKNKVVITGGTGRFASELKKITTKLGNDTRRRTTS